MADEKQIIEFVLRDTYWRTIDRDMDEKEWRNLFDRIIADLFDAGVSVETLQWLSVQYVKDEFNYWKVIHLQISFG